MLTWYQLVWYFLYKTAKGLIPVAASSKAWVCGRSLPGMAGSIPAGAWLFVLNVFCCQVEA
jgi:hypothetical protein